MENKALKHISRKIILAFSLLLFVDTVFAAIPKQSFDKKPAPQITSTIKTTNSGQSPLIFDLPVTYNYQVSFWVNHFQTRGQRWFREWLERASRYLPFIQEELLKAGLPADLAFMVMIESGFSSHAKSTANAVGPWQFIPTTGYRYGLEKTWWLDERKDLRKATHAAIRYIKDIRKEYRSWYLVAAAYNMGENGLRRIIKRHGTDDYWTLVRKKAIPKETQEYVPKILAAMLISKAPSLYGFRSLERYEPLQYDIIAAPGGTDIDKLADKIGVTRKSLRDLNAELLLGYVPKNITHHHIRVPKGSAKVVMNMLSDLSPQP
jgi:membrane-bound lytic murein transglycosylase D